MCQVITTKEHATCLDVINPRSIERKDWVRACVNVYVYILCICVSRVKRRHARLGVASLCSTDQAGSKQVQSERRDEGTMCVGVCMFASSV